jgi:predicted nucleic acid-binding Zn ribbon protein
MTSSQPPEPPGAGPPPEASGGEGDPAGPADAPDAAEVADAAAAALARARAAARAKGLRPGLRPRRRRKDVPASQRSEPGSRDPQLLGDQLDSFVAERGWKVDVAVGSVIGRWPQIVGAEIAQHCAPVAFQDGVLTVRADSSAWAFQLQLLGSSLLGRLTADVGEGTVTELRILGPGGPSWSHGPRRATDGRGPRDTYG